LSFGITFLFYHVTYFRLKAFFILFIFLAWFIALYTFLFCSCFAHILNFYCILFGFFIEPNNNKITFIFHIILFFYNQITFIFFVALFFGAFSVIRFFLDFLRFRAFSWHFNALFAFLAQNLLKFNEWAYFLAEYFYQRFIQGGLTLVALGFNLLTVMVAFWTLLTLHFTLFTFEMTLLTSLTFLKMTHLALAISGRLYHIWIFRVIGFDLNIFVVIGAEARFITLGFLNNLFILILAACNWEFNRGNFRHCKGCICVFSGLSKSRDIVGKLFDTWLMLECDETI